METPPCLGRSWRSWSWKPRASHFRKPSPTRNASLRPFFQVDVDAVLPGAEVHRMMRCSEFSKDDVFGFPQHDKKSPQKLEFFLHRHSRFTAVCMPTQALFQAELEGWIGLQIQETPRIMVEIAGSIPSSISFIGSCPSIQLSWVCVKMCRWTYGFPWISSPFWSHW